LATQPAATQPNGTTEQLTLVRLTSSTFTDPLEESDALYAYRRVDAPGMQLTQWYAWRGSPEKVDLDALAAELRADPTLLEQRFLHGTDYWDAPGERWTLIRGDPADPDDPGGLGSLDVYPPELDPVRHQHADGGSVLTGWLSVINASALDVISDAPTGERATPAGDVSWVRAPDGSRLDVTVRRRFDHQTSGVPVWVSLRAQSLDEQESPLRDGPAERDRRSHSTMQLSFEPNRGESTALLPFARVRFTAETHPGGDLAWEQKGHAVLVHAIRHTGDPQTLLERFRPQPSEGTPVLLLDRNSRPTDGVPRVWRNGKVERADDAD
jgi:hypothetical protein